MTEPTAVYDADGVRDFSGNEKTLKFRIGKDVFEAVSDIAAELALDYAAQTEKMSQEGMAIDKQKDAIRAIFRMILLPESADVFIARLSDPENPIGHKKITEITRWLFEEYGMRPTIPDSAS
jgi:hypothetical protein